MSLLVFMEGILIAGMLLFRAAQTRASRRLIKPLYIVAVLLVPPTGLLLPNYNYFYVMMILLPFAARGNAKTLACLYLAMLIQFPDMSQAYIIGNFYFGTVTAVTMLNLGALIALLFLRRRERRNPGVLDACAWGMFFILLFSQIRGLPVSGVLRQTQFYFLGFMVPYLLLSRTLRTRDDAMEALLVFTWSAFLCAMVAGFESVRGWPLYQQIPLQLHVQAVGQGLSATLSVRSGFLRAQGPVANPTSLGIVLAIGALFAPGLKRYFTKPQVMGVYAVLILGLIVTQSRGAWIGAAAGYLIRLLFQRKYGAFGGFIALAMALWIGSAVVASEGSRLNQLLGRSGGAEQTAQYRSDLARRGLAEIGKHPLQGQTPEQLQITMDDMRQGEGIIDFVNSHLYIALVTGLGGLMLWLLTWVCPIGVALKAKSALRGTAWQMPLELPASAVAACFVALLFTSPIDRNPSLVALALGFTAVLVRVTRRGDPGAKPKPSKPGPEAMERILAYT